MSVTSIEEIKKKAAIEVELPGWDNKPFICKLKRVGVLGLASSGKIPNTLMSTAMGMFEKKLDVKEPDDIKNMAEVINLFCKEAMVEPKYDEVQAVNLLTDDQRLAIFDFTQDGVKKVKPSSKK